MKRLLPVVACLMLVACAPPPVAKSTHKEQIQQVIAKVGGETNILNESRTLFARLAAETNSVLFTVREKPRYLEGLSGITNLGDVFRYEPSEPNRISVRVHNSHFDTYFILLVNPDLPQHQGFEQISGNVGFID